MRSLYSQVCEWIVTVIVLSTRIDLSSSGNAQLDPSMSTYIRFGRYERPISTNRKEQITKRKKIDVRRSDLSDSNSVVRFIGFCD